MTGSLAPAHSLAPEERHRILHEWNDTSREYPRDLCLHQLFEAQAQRNPEAAAVVFEGRALTYRELNVRANRLAQALRRHGVGPETLVGICVERSMEMVIGLLAILKAGGGYVPLDPSSPRQRLSFMLQDAGVSVLLTQERLVAELPAAAWKLILLDGDDHGVRPEDTENPASAVTDENLAYVIYTSGSTGKPKGAMNTHRGICNRLLWMQETYRLEPEDRVLQKTPFSFDVSVWEFFWPLLNGASLVLARPGGHQDSAYLVRTIAEHGITVLHFVPSMLNVFLEAEGLENCRSLRLVICSGESLPFKLQERFFSRLEARLHNLYGPTEAAVDVTAWECERKGSRRSVPIGRPVANTQVYLLDSNLQPVSVGQPGELYIGGVQVGRGYLHRPDWTAAAFVPNPFGGASSSRLYKTGDLARALPDGNIEFLGRVDQQVKIHGFRIELGEIEAALNEHTAVREAVVTVREEPAGERRLAAYLVIHGQPSPSASELRRFLAEKLPDYMLPSTFTELPALPLSPNGKVDRQALPAPSRERPQLDESYVAPRTDLERFLAALWGEVLKLDRVGVHDKFFELGGDSIQAATLINTLQRELGEFIYVVTLFEAPSIAKFASFLSRDYAEAVSKRFGLNLSDRGKTGKTRTDSAPPSRIDRRTLEHMRSLVPVLSESSSASSASREPANPAAIFLLAPPRSGTTLLRVMLAGHPGLFAAAELQLLGFHTLSERKAAFAGKFSMWLEGTLRAIMEIKGCGAEEAKEIIGGYERRGFTTKEFYRELQQWIAPKTLVDKSPSYALDIRALRKAESDFKDPLYIHLVRHPYAMVRSFESYHMDQVLFLREHSYTPRRLGELVWTVSHQTILEFLGTVPAHRQHRIRFEDLTHRPGDAMKAMCQRLGLEFHADLLDPYKDKEKKMTDGIYAASTPMGDTKFREHGEIKPEVASRWGEVREDNFLGDVTWEVAGALGYGPPALPGAEVQARGVETRRGAPAPRNSSLRRQHRLRTEHRVKPVVADR